MEKFSIKRDGLPPIAFTGELIGSARSHGDRYTRVTIYRTIGGNFIAEIEYITCWQGERDSFLATAKKTAAELISWLQENSGESKLGRISQEAVEKAALVEPAFAAAWMEVVE